MKDNAADPPSPIEIFDPVLTWTQLWGTIMHLISVLFYKHSLAFIF